MLWSCVRETKSATGPSNHLIHLPSISGPTKESCSAQIHPSCDYKSHPLQNLHQALFSQTQISPSADACCHNSANLRTVRSATSATLHSPIAPLVFIPIHHTSDWIQPNPPAKDDNFSNSRTPREYSPAIRDEPTSPIQAPEIASSTKTGPISRQSTSRNPFPQSSEPHVEKWWTVRNADPQKSTCTTLSKIDDLESTSAQAYTWCSQKGNK